MVYLILPLVLLDTLLPFLPGPVGELLDPIKTQGAEFE
jgi:hypothetical protein